MKPFFLAFVLTLLLSGCQTSDRYHQQVDSKPLFDYGDIELIDAVPIYEPYRLINSRPYTVLGQSYVPLLNGKGFEEQGLASWYGQKFHGHQTSTGEVYDMFKMTAAHKTLPLPSFAKITNLSNQKTVIVKINDRGPFHSDRIVDLSYAAAKKLDFLKDGVAEVKLEVIYIDENGNKTIGTGPTATPAIPISIAIAKEPPHLKQTQRRYIQIAAISDLERAQSLTETLSAMFQVDASNPLIDRLYRVRLGPIKTEQKAKNIIESLKEKGFDSAFQVIETSK